MLNPYGTIETCEGTACARCKIEVSMCACRGPDRKLAYRSVAERISGQGMVPETEFTQEKTAA